MRLLLVTLFLFSSCASYVNSIHKQIDSEEAAKRAARQRAMQRYYGRGSDNRPIQNPVTLNGLPTANNQKNFRPGVRRNYSQGTKRYKAEDLVDNNEDGSLWSGKNSESFLFVTNNLKRKGDIVIVEVMSNLKNKIQDELKRNFPDPPKKKTKKDGDGKEEEKKEETPAPVSTAQDDPNKIYDKISTRVIEQVNQDYLLIRGRKEIMFKEQKRYFEIQAVVSQKDISSEDSVSSIRILEPRINVLRY